MPRLPLLILIVLVAGGIAYGVKQFMRTGEIPQASQVIERQAPEVMVLVAVGGLDAGRFVREENTRWQAWPDVELPASYFVQSRSDAKTAFGAVARRTISKGEPVTAGAIVFPGDRGFLAAVLDAGMRAISVPVDESSSNAGLIQPGDRIDVILTQIIDQERPGRTARRVSETVLHDIRVIAMGGALASDDDVAPSRQQVRTVTLEVTPAQAEQLTLVTELGRLSLSLRSVIREETTERGGGSAQLDAPTWDWNVSKVLTPQDQSNERPFVILRGSASSAQESFDE